MNDAAEPPDLAHIPEALLGPVLETAGLALRSADKSTLPPSVRRLAGFGKKGLATPAARAQLHRLLDTDDAYRATVVEQYLARPDVADLLAIWEAGHGRREAALLVVGRAAGDGSLPLLAGLLACGHPPGWELGLGLVIGTYASEQGAAALAERAGGLEERLAAVEEARRRADEARAGAVEKARGLEAELRAERAARRERDRGGTAEAAAARRLAAGLEKELAESRRRAGEAEARAVREAEQARGAESRLAGAQEEVEAGRRALRAAQDLRAVAGALAGDADRLAERLSELATTTPPDTGLAGTGPAASTGASGRRAAPSARRQKVQVPPGMRVDTASALEAMLQTPGLQVIIDGYNVSMLAWTGISLAEQRDRLTAALGRLHLRARRPLTVAFDGAGVEGARPPRQPGVTVLFSAAGQEADDVVVEQVGERPPSVPVLVVSSDRAVGERSEALGAHVVPSALFLEVLRR